MTILRGLRARPARRCTYAAVSAQVSAGKLRVLAVPSQERIKALPDVPTVGESGYKDIDADTWYGVLAPARTPKEKVAQLAGCSARPYSRQK